MLGSSDLDHTNQEMPPSQNDNGKSSTHTAAYTDPAQLDKINTLLLSYVDLVQDLAEKVNMLEAMWKKRKHDSLTHPQVTTPSSNDIHIVGECDAIENNNKSEGENSGRETSKHNTQTSRSIKAQFNGKG